MRLGHHFQGQKVIRGQRSKGQGHQAALVGCTGRPTWTYSNGDLSICVHDVYRVITCRPGRGHIVAAARLQLVSVIDSNGKCPNSFSAYVVALCCSDVESTLAPLAGLM